MSFRLERSGMPESLKNISDYKIPAFAGMTGGAIHPKNNSRPIESNST